jgi:hypothetical protein
MGVGVQRRAQNINVAGMLLRGIFAELLDVVTLLPGWASIPMSSSSRSQIGKSTQTSNTAGIQVSR